MHWTELDTALEEWMAMLGLPQLAVETRRKEAARQLHTVLIEKLMLQRLPN